MNVALSVLTGILVALMIRANGALQAAAGPLTALSIIHAAGIAGAALFQAGARTLGAGPRLGARPAGHTAGVDGTASGAPRISLIAGILGIPIVYVTNEVFLRGGVLLTLSGTLAGQVVVAWVLERTRWMRAGSAAPLQRLLSVVLLLPGTILIGLRSGVGALWVAASWVPGMILMVQMTMNAANGLRFGLPRMLLFNYGTALLVLLPWLLLSRALPDPETPRTIPAYLYAAGGVLGVCVIGLSSFLLGRGSALVIVLATYTGQMGMGIILDRLAGATLSWEQLLGVLLVLAGLVSGDPRLNRRRTPSGQHG